MPLLLYWGHFQDPWEYPPHFPAPHWAWSVHQWPQPHLSPAVFTVTCMDTRHLSVACWVHIWCVSLAGRHTRLWLLPRLAALLINLRDDINLWAASEFLRVNATIPEQFPTLFICHKTVASDLSASPCVEPLLLCAVGGWAAEDGSHWQLQAGRRGTLPPWGSCSCAAASWCKNDTLFNILTF